MRGKSQVAMGPLGALNVLAKGRTARNFFTSTDLQIAEQTNPNFCVLCFKQNGVSPWTFAPGTFPGTLSPSYHYLNKKL